MTALLLSLLVVSAHAAPAAPAKSAPKPRTLNVGHPADMVVKIGQDIVLAPGQAVDGPVVAVGGSVTVDGPINGPVVALGGSTTAGPQTVVNGPVVSFGGPVQIDPAASVHGPIVRMPGGRMFAALLPPLAGLAAAAAFTILFGKTLAALGWIALAVVLWALFPEPLDNTRRTLAARAGACALWGLIAWPALGLIAVAFAISLVGLPFVPLVALLLGAAYVWGSVALAYWIGGRVTGRSERALLSIVVGIVALKLVGFIPLVGRLVAAAVMVLGAGAAFASRFGSRAPAA